MDKNRLIQIANHFDKIGAYTISDEFENKFLRLAAPVDERTRRSQNVERSVGRDPLESGSYFASNVSRFFGNLNPFDREGRQIARQQFSINMIRTWIRFLASYLAKDPKYLLYKSSISKLTKNFLDAQSLFTNVQSPVLLPAQEDGDYLNRLLLTRNDLEQVQKELMQFVDDQDGSFANISFNPYINKLHEAENSLLELRNQYNTRNPPVPTTPSGGGSAPAPAGGGAGSAPAGGGAGSAPAGGGAGSAPSGGAPAGGGARPSAPAGGPSRPQGSSGSSGGGSRTQSRPSASSAKKININEELSKIVFRKLRAVKPGADEKQIFMDMRLGADYKAYLEISKNKELKGSIIAAINASKFSNDDKDRLKERLEKKIQDAIELNKPKPPAKTDESKPSGEVRSDGSGTQNQSGAKPDTSSDDAKKLNTFNFTCDRQGLEAELKRLEALYDDDPDKFMRDFSADISRAIKCHNFIRNRLELKDNTYFDTFANDLERKYFAYIYRRDLPY